ncbi:hypothetical protein B5X24_HaOG208871 [Helicoverpa armigera]|nr:hypothetical protein B5X24_HaOG208871 [Helicoverpa armigera]
MTEKPKRKVQYLAGVCAAFAFTFTGATLAWSSPAIPKFKNGEANIVITDTQTSWVVSLHSAGALLGCYIGQVLNEKAGRRRTFFGSAVPGLLGATIMLNTSLPELMSVARFLMGVSTGTIAVVTMIYVTEIADKEIRGALGMTVQVMNNLGGLTVYSVGPFVSYTTLNCIILIIPICYVLLCLWIPESPYYHLKDGRVEAAKKEFMRLKGTTDETVVDDQMRIMRAHVKESMENKTTLKELLTNMKYRKAVYIVTGIGATFLSRWFGRRILLLISCFGVSVAMTIVGLYFFLQDTIQVSAETSQAISWMPLVGILSFNVLYAVGVGNLPYVLQAELFPVNVKGVASSTATMLACILSFLVTKCYQQVKDACGHYMVFWSFALIGYIGVFFIYFFVPETKGKTLEEVQNNIQEQRPEEEALNAEKAEKV